MLARPQRSTKPHFLTENKRLHTRDCGLSKRIQFLLNLTKGTVSPSFIGSLIHPFFLANTDTGSTPRCSNSLLYDAGSQQSTERSRCWHKRCPKQHGQQNTHNPAKPSIRRSFYILSHFEVGSAEVEA